jgi:hypothetical protein
MNYYVQLDGGGLDGLLLKNIEGKAAKNGKRIH